jgi:hypothetical protein
VFETMLVGGFQHGGVFTVPGVGGPDSQLVSFKATPGETVAVFPQGIWSALGQQDVKSGDVIINISGVPAQISRRNESGNRVIDIMVEQVIGAIGTSLSKGEGIAPIIERRYGLSPAAGVLR